MVYEDALTILSYASPYEVILEAEGGKTTFPSTVGKSLPLGHPIYRSSSNNDLMQVCKN